MTHATITLERVEEAVRSSNLGGLWPGFCKACGEEADAVEPDAREYTCECCGEPQVFGAEELLMEML